MDAQELDPRSMVGRNRYSDQILQQKARKSSSSEGPVVTTNNVVVWNTEIGG